MNKRMLIGAAGVALALVTASACGDSSSSSSTTDTGGASSGGDFALDSSPEIVLLWEMQGESPYGIDDYQHGAELALKEINAAGGVGGQPVTGTRVSASVTDVQAAVDAVLQGADKEPAAMVGLPSPDQVKAVSPQLERLGVPVIATLTTETDYMFGAPSGSEFLWIVGPPNQEIVSAGTDYLIDPIGAEKIGLMGTNESSGTNAIAAATATLEAQGMKPYAVAQYAPDASDLTPQVLQMEGADAVLNWGYPGPMAVQLKQFEQNGLDIPTMASTAIQIPIASGVVTPSQRENLYSSEPCNPAAPANDAMKTFVASYQAEFGEVPSQNAAYAYDAVNVAVAAIKEAKSVDGEKVNAALPKVTFAGSCSKYQADEAHVLGHDAQITKYTATTAEAVKTLSFAPEPAR